MDLRIVVHIKGFLRHEEIVGDAAVAHGGIAPIQIHVQRRADNAHHRKGFAGHSVQGVLVIGRQNRHLGAQDTVVIPEAVSQAFVRAFRHAPAEKGQPVDSLRYVVKTVDGVAFFFFAGN